MIHKMGYDGQCERCGDPVMDDEVDHDGNCEACHADLHDRWPVSNKEAEAVQ